MIVIVWEFRIRANKRADFEQHYGPDGTWARLFHAGKGYAGTRLLRDVSDPHRYVTIDRWESAGDFERFKAANAKQYQKTDKSCEALTVSERHIGTFDSVA